MFLLCAVKVPDAVTEMMMAELHHQEACQRINSILKFYTLWRFRYQVWPRMEEGAQQIFKVPGRSVPVPLTLTTAAVHLSLYICLSLLPPPPTDPASQHQLHAALPHPGHALRPHIRPALGAAEHGQRAGPHQ